MQPSLLKRFASGQMRKWRRTFTSVILLSLLLFMVRNVITRDHETAVDENNKDFKDANVRKQSLSLKITRDHETAVDENNKDFKDANVRKQSLSLKITRNHETAEGENNKDYTDANVSTQILSLKITRDYEAVEDENNFDFKHADVNTQSHSLKITRDHETAEDDNNKDFKDANVSTQRHSLKITRNHETAEDENNKDYKDANVSTQILSLKNGYQWKASFKFQRSFIIPEPVFSLRTFRKPRYRLRSRTRTICDEEVFREGGHKKKLIVSYNTPNSWIVGFNFSRCECSQCEIVYSQNITHADIVLFHGVLLNIQKPPPRPKGQIWVVFGSEAPVYYTGNLYKPQWRNVFNWTSTHRIDSDIFNPYGVLMQRNGPLRTRTFYESAAKSKTKYAIAIISHCLTKSLREKYIRELQRYMSVDVYGHCGKQFTCAKHNDTCVQEFVQRYTFLLAFENSLCEDYVTEKFFRTYIDDFLVIPVVRGGTGYQRYFPNGTYIDAADFNTPKDLASHLIRIRKDHKKVADILEAKSRYKSITMHHQCPICYMLHKYNITTSGIDPRVPAAERARLTKSYTDPFRWLLEGKCYNPQDFTGAPKNR